jgi:hypothetical protein
VHIATKFIKLFALFQMLDEYVDLFEDIRSGDHNDLGVRLNVSKVLKPDYHFWCRYARHGQRLSRKFHHLAGNFSEMQHHFLANYCLSRENILSTRVHAISAITAGDRQWI